MRTDNVQIVPPIRQYSKVVLSENSLLIRVTLRITKETYESLKYMCKSNPTLNTQIGVFYRESRYYVTSCIRHKGNFTVAKIQELNYREAPIILQFLQEKVRQAKKLTLCNIAIQLKLF